VQLGFGQTADEYLIAAPGRGRSCNASRRVRQAP